MDALAVVAEEGRLYTSDIVGEAVSSLRSGGFRMGKPSRLWREVYRKRIARKRGV